MDLKELQHVRYFGDAEKNYAVNLLKTIAEATDGRIGFDSRLIAKVQSAHNTLELYKKKRATEKQLLDVFATVGLAFVRWMESTGNQIGIEAVADAVADPLGSLEDVEAKEEAVEIAQKVDAKIIAPKTENEIIEEERQAQELGENWVAVKRAEWGATPEALDKIAEAMAVPGETPEDLKSTPADYSVFGIKKKQLP